MMFTARHGLYIAILCYVPSLLVAQTLPDTVRGRYLKEVTVKPGVLRDTSGTPVQVLKGRELERMGSLSVADAVRYFSGVQLKDYGGVGGLKTVNVRSLGTNHTAVFYDGIRLGNAQNGQVDLGKFSLDNIEEIALYDGGKSSIFQPASGFASASSLYLTARQPVFAPGTSSSGKISAKGGSFGLLDPSLLWQYKVCDKLYSTLSTEWITANGRYPYRSTNGVYDTTLVRTNGAVDARRVEAGVNGRLSDSAGWSAKFYLYNSSRGLPNAVVNSNYHSDQHLWDRNIFLQGAYHRDGVRYSLLANAKYTSDYTRYLDPDYVQTTGFLDNRYKEQQLYFSLAQLYRINARWNVSFSTDYIFNTLDANLYHFAYPTRNTWLNALAAELHFPGLNLQASLLGTIVSDKVRQYASAGDKNELTPAVLLSWKPFNSESFRVRGFYKRIFRMPTFNDLYYTFVGNTFLKPEYADQYDAGVTYNKTFSGAALEGLSFQTDAYFNRVTDKIIAVPGANLFRWSMMNVSKVDIKGLTVNLQSFWLPARNVRIKLALTYTYEQSLDKTAGRDEYDQRIPYSPLHSGSLLAGAEWKALSVNYSFIYTGSRYFSAANIPVNYLQPWYTHDASVRYALPFHGHMIKSGVEVNNLFNQDYEVVVNFPMPKRNYRLTIQFTW